MKIYTRTGDRGETSLFGGGRVSKHAPRVAAYGDVDELNAIIGQARALAPASLEQDLLEAIQRDLFAVGGRLASPRPDKVAGALEKATLDAERIHALEAAIDRLEDDLPELTAFILPGGAPKAAAFHVARTVCRRAERAVVALRDGEDVPDEILTYLNRLSDLLFVLARTANRAAGHADHPW